MINALTGIGYAIIGLAVVLGIGIVLLSSLSTNIAQCPTGYSYNWNGTDTFTSNVCCKSTGWSDCSSAGNSTPAKSGASDVTTLSGYLGTSNGGLASWVPIIIVLVIGMLFLGIFLSRKGKRN